VTLGVVARRLGIPCSDLFVLGGLALGFVPGLPPIRLAPNLIFLGFLPPLVLAAGQGGTVGDARPTPFGLWWLRRQQRLDHAPQFIAD
jgi:hypothetical protein